MRLERLDLTRYGRFTDRSLVLAQPAPGGPDLHVVYGPNEAGKSTLFSAWLDLLFGIPSRTRHDFLHPGPTMRIGAVLTHAGDTLDITRLKRNGPSLFDRHDAPLPDAVLQGALGGLTRDGYSAMFSLDDDTLEKGGEGILASRGDLGEMLFSASAGLSSLAPQLDALRKRLDGFHASGKRSGWLHDARKELAALDRQRKDLEVSAGALQKLTRDATATEQAWRAARAREEAMQADLDRLQDLAGTLPLRSRLAGLHDRLAPLNHLPDAVPDVLARFTGIETDRRDLANRIADRALRLQGLEDQRAALPDDPDALAQAAAIDAAEALRPAHDTAVADLPRRREAAQDATGRMAVLLAKLGHADAAPADICLSAARLSSLRALLTARSGLQGAAASAAAETRKAAALRDRERDRLGDPGPAEDAAALAALVARLRAQDPADLLARALRDRDEARGRLDAAIAALAPWTGDADSLAALAVPSDGQIAGWADALDTAHQQMRDAGRDADALRDDLARLHAAAAEHAAAQAAGGVTLDDAAEARRSREAHWAAHLADLTAASARHFEQAMRVDDRISALLADAMADARRVARDRAAQDSLAARLAEADARQAAACAALTATRTAIDAACVALGLPGCGLPDLTAWRDRRATALAERAALRDAETGVARCTEAVEVACRTLGAALGRSVADPAPDFEILFAEAVARLEASDRRREARDRLRALDADLRDRQQAEADAAAALAAWRQGWADASRDSILAGWSDDDPGLGTVLDLLDQLGSDHQAAAALHDRIDKMEANRARFVAAKAGVLAVLDLGDTTAWSDVLARLRRAQDAARDRDTLTRQIAQERQQDIADHRQRDARDAEAHRLGAALGWTGGDDSLADHVARCHAAATLRRDIAVLADDLRDRPVPAAHEDADTVRQAMATLKTDLQILRTETETCLAAHLDAKRRIDAVGGDDALARIAAARETLLLDIRDRAEAHLAARFGLMSFEAGLRRYRDSHRSAMLARASDAFGQLSRGAYAGLAAQPDGAQEVLVALAADGGAKLAADLSKGTRFQLYLALRIAGYHELARSRPTVPFIADDIMETFDDDRSGAAFALLADMSRVGQVIYLTHHRHLCDIARAVCPYVNVVDLGAT